MDKTVRIFTFFFRNGFTLKIEFVSVQLKTKIYNIIHTYIILHFTFIILYIHFTYHYLFLMYLHVSKSFNRGNKH